MMRTPELLFLSKVGPEAQEGGDGGRRQGWRRTTAGFGGVVKICYPFSFSISVPPCSNSRSFPLPSLSHSCSTIAPLLLGCCLQTLQLWPKNPTCASNPPALHFGDRRAWHSASSGGFQLQATAFRTSVMGGLSQMKRLPGVGDESPQAPEGSLSHLVSDMNMQD